MFTSFKFHFWVCAVNEIVCMPLSDFPGQLFSEQSFVLKNYFWGEVTLRL